MKFVKSKNFIYSLISIIVIIVVTSFFRGNGDYETYTVERGDFSQIAEINGKITPAQDLNLAFEVVGKISRIYVDTGDIVKVGDILAELDSSEVSSELSEVLANLDKERSKLDEISGNSTSQNELQNSAETLLSIIKRSYVTADDVIRNNVDILFDDPESRNPEFSTALGNYFLRQEINDKRKYIGLMLKEWKSDIDILNSSIINNQDATNAINNLKQIEDLLAAISSGVDDFQSIGTFSQSQIDAYISKISSSRNTMSDEIVTLNNSYNDFRNVQAELPVIQASVENARASVDKISARRSKYVLTAPFSGIITEQNLELGQVVSANETIISMISEEAFEVEAFVPELNIIGLNVGDKATLKLDAFGPDRTFDAEVSHVDPRETIKDGVTTYRILINLLEKDEEIRSGMTVDIILEKQNKEDQIVIPRYIILNDENGDYVEIKNGDNYERRNISLGEIDGQGGIIVESGLNEGDKIIIKQ
jgi:HlyD family secretion protein